MHPGQVEVGVATVERALEEQVPEIFGLPVSPVEGAGTVVAPFRVGEAFVARFPLVPSADAVTRVRLRAEAKHALALAGRLPVEMPRPIQVGEPFDGYPGYWSLWTWVEGDSLDRASGLDVAHLTDDLAALLRAFRALPAEGWSGTGRGGRPLADSDWVRTSIERSAHLLDADAATAVWEHALAAPPHVGPPVRLHGDPLPGNLIVRDGRLAGLVDIAEPVCGDPAADLQPAWVSFEGADRERFRAAMGLDDAAWERGRGWAFEMAIGGLHYYEHTNAGFHAMAARTLARLLESR